MAGRTGVVKGKLYGDWGLSEMEAEKDLTDAGGRTGIMAKAAKRAAAEKAKKLAAEKKKAAKRSDRDKWKTDKGTGYSTREITQGGKVISQEPYKVIKAEDYAKTKASRKAVNKNIRKRKGEPEVSSRTKQNLRGIQRWL